jgi:hypothetical protein
VGPKQLAIGNWQLAIHSPDRELQPRDRTAGPTRHSVAGLENLWADRENLRLDNLFTILLSAILPSDRAEKKLKE